MIIKRSSGSMNKKEIGEALKPLLYHLPCREFCRNHESDCDFTRYQNKDGWLRDDKRICGYAKNILKQLGVEPQ